MLNRETVDSLRYLKLEAEKKYKHKFDKNVICVYCTFSLSNFIIGNINGKKEKLLTCDQYVVKDILC